MYGELTVLFFVYFTDIIAFRNYFTCVDDDFRVRFIKKNCAVQYIQHRSFINDLLYFQIF